MRSFNVFLISYGVFSFLATVTKQVRAEEFRFDINTEIGVYARSYDSEKTDLFPNGKSAGLLTNQAGADVSVTGTLGKGPLRLSGKSRFSYLPGSTSPVAEVTADELYAEVRFSDHLFGYFGRRSLAFGQSYGFIPVDIYNQPLKEKRLYPSDKSRNDMEGVDLIGFDFLTKNGDTFKMFYAPEFEWLNEGFTEDNWYLSYSTFFETSGIDVTTSAFWGERPGVGLSGSVALGDKVVLYADGTMRRNREKKTLQHSKFIDGFTFASGNDNRVFTYLTLGSGYTFDNGLSVNLEYTYDGSGYSQDEWDDIDESINLASSMSGSLASRARGQINTALRHHSLRRNYAFLRMAKDDLLDLNLESEFTLLHGLDDQSGRVGLRLEKEITEGASIGVFASHRYGKENSEFRLRPDISSLALYTLIRF
ncbi:hypothetical protein [Polycladidibacter stylochi]|uniref:hypothetical protein n=1 Tax=Polycladidibacter stylochi TaxID=1807766 RepID=UPI0008330DFD|nr:hypothetical protein [Pseudovibrio stylochi]